ncbi:hypothetical protein [Streptococcus infantarius]|uniref:hypothetical protein n=1 Tax=Streptococcus infantarius TaxID=102684 RepID=UPI003C192DF1
MSKLIAQNQTTLMNLTERAETRKETFYKLTNSANAPAVDGSWSSTALVPTQSQRYLWQFEYVYYSDGSIETTQPINISIAGADGKTSYIHIAYASSSDGKTGFSFTDTKQQYQGYYTDFTQTSSTDPTKYTWTDRTANVQVGGRNLIIRSQIQRGYIDANGNLATASNQFTTGFIDGTNSKQFTITAPKFVLGSLEWYRLAKYDANKNFIGRDLISYAKDAKTVKTITLDTNVAYFKVSFDGVYGDPFKIERGNIATDYSQAPEDTQADIDSKADQNLTQDQLNALTEKNNLIKAEMEAKATVDEVNKWITAYQNYVSNNDKFKGDSEKALQEASARLLQLNTDVGALKQQWTFIDTYMTVQNEGLIIGKSDGSAYAKFANDRISLFSGGSEVMYISQGVLRIENGIFTKTIQIGRFRFETHPADKDMLVLRYLGGV